MIKGIYRIESASLDVRIGSGSFVLKLADRIPKGVLISKVDRL